MKEELENMEKKDENIIKHVTIAGIDAIVASIDNTINGGYPALGLAWALSKGLYGAGIQLRQERAIEFIEMIRNNPEIFTKNILNSQEFQDGFVYTFQKYLSERIEEKRRTIKNIFLGFGEEVNKSEFKMEKYLFTLEQLSLEDIEIIKTFSDGTIKKWLRSQFSISEMSEEEVDKRLYDTLNVPQIGELLLADIKGFNQFRDGNYTLESLLRLSNIGLLIGAVSTDFDFHASSNFKISRFGKEFVVYILK